MRKPIQLYHGAYVVRRGENAAHPWKCLRDKTRPEAFHVGPDMYFEDGTPIAPGLFGVPLIDFVFEPGIAEDYGLTHVYDPNAGYKFDKPPK